MFKIIYKSMRFVTLIALIISTLMVFSANYYIFNQRVETEIISQADMVAGFINKSLSETGIYPDNIPVVTEKKSMLILSPQNSAIYTVEDSPEYFPDTYEKMSEMDEVKQAIQNGSGKTERYVSKALFSGKIFSYAQKLNDGSILVVACGTLDVFSLMTELAVVLIFMCVLIFIFTAIISKRLTENIVAPIEKISLSDIDNLQSPYDELKPFINRISYQSREILHQMDRVKRQKLRLQAISESMNEGLVVLDKDLNILSINPSAVKAFNIKDTSSVINTSIISLVDNNLDFSDNLINASHNTRGSFLYTLNERTYEVFYSPVGENGTVIGVVILMFDMTDKMRNEQIRTEFTANVSHELKTPLTSIHGYAQLITSGIAKPEDMKMFALKIEKESTRLIALVEDIIKLSHLDENVTPEKSQFSIRDLICDITDYLKLPAQEKDVQVSLSSGDFNVFASKSQMYELLYNIVDNAIKYNKISGKVSIDISDNSVTVSDTGIGIPDEYSERIFERFFRVDKSHSKKVNGTGLGLSIVKHIAINNGIKIKVSSKLSEGSVFTCDFTNVISK